MTSKIGKKRKNFKINRKGRIFKLTTSGRSSDLSKDLAGLISCNRMSTDRIQEPDRSCPDSPEYGESRPTGQGRVHLGRRERHLHGRLAGHQNHHQGWDQDGDIPTKEGLVTAV